MIIEIKGLSKSFKNIVLLAKVDITFESGKIYGITGQNGCGKTLLLKMMLGLSPFQEGVIKQDNMILGKDILALNSIGATLEEPKFYNELSGSDNLFILSNINKKVKKETIDYLIDMFDLRVDINKRVGRYSLGMKQKLALIQALMEEPEVLILDEPTNALDNHTLEKLFDYLKEMKKKGCLVIVTLHKSSEIKALCDEVYLISDHKLKKK